MIYRITDRSKILRKVSSISAANLKDIKKAAQYANKTIAVCKAILAAGDSKTDQAIAKASLKKCGDILDAL